MFKKMLTNQNCRRVQQVGQDRRGLLGGGRHRVVQFEVKPYKRAAGTRDGFYGLVIVRVDE